MKFSTALACLLMCCSLSGATAQDLGDAKKEAAFSFAGVEYFLRFTKNDQREYTPTDQEDLTKWQDMMTILHYRHATNAEALATQANGVRENYKQAGGTVIRTNSVPRTKEKPAEHFIVVLFARPAFFEVAFARLKMQEAMGAAAIYSHRIYGDEAEDEMAAWLKENGPATEKQLMAWEHLPQPSANP